VAPGGQLILAAKAAWRRHIDSVVGWRVAELNYLGVDIKDNQLVAMEDVLLHKPDVVIVATDGIPNLGDLMPIGYMLVCSLRLDPGRHEPRFTTGSI